MINYSKYGDTDIILKRKVATDIEIKRLTNF